MKKLLIFFLVIILLALGISGILLIVQKSSGLLNGDSASFNKEEVFKAEGIKELSIGTVGENITFTTVKSNEIKVSFKGNVIATNKDAIPEIQTKNENGKLSIQIQRKDLGSVFYYHSEAQLEIAIPENYSENIVVHTVSGNTSINNLNIKDLSISSVSGNVKMDQMSVKAASVETTSGESSIKGFKGDLFIKEISGNISLDYLEFKNTTTMDTISGNIEIRLPQNAEFSLKANTVSGIINNTFPLNTIVAQKNNLEGSVGNGNNGKIQLTTTSGNISVLK